MKMIYSLPNNNLEQNQKKQKYYGYYGTKGKIPSLLKYGMLTTMQQNKIYLVHWPQSMIH